MDAFEPKENVTPEPSLYSNRAMAHLKLGNNQHTVDDCTLALDGLDDFKKVGKKLEAQLQNDLALRIKVLCKNSNFFKIDFWL